MSYVGNTPALKYVNFAVQHFTTSATTSYTLDQSVSNEVEIALFINNVRQEPGSSYSYTATGTALTLSQATAGSDTMYCVFIGKAVETNNPPAGSVNTSELVDNAVSTAKVQSDAITYDKIQDLGSANRVLGGASTGTVGEVQITDSMSNFVSTSSNAGLQIKGDGTTDGTLQLNCSQNTHGIKIKSPPHSANASYTLTMPTTDGNTSEFLQTNGSGTLTWAEAGGGGKVGQMISTQLASEQSTTSTSFVPITGVTNTITPTATSSKIWIQGTLLWGRSTNNTMWMQMFRGSTLINEQTFATGSNTDSFYASGTNSGYYVLRQAPFSFLDSPSTTSATTYTIKWRVDGNTIWLNRIGADTNQGGTSQLNTLEILA